MMNNSNSCYLYSKFGLPIMKADLLWIIRLTNNNNLIPSECFK